ELVSMGGSCVTSMQHPSAGARGPLPPATGSFADAVEATASMTAAARPKDRSAMEEPPGDHPVMQRENAFAGSAWSAGHQTIGISIRLMNKDRGNRTNKWALAVGNRPIQARGGFHGGSQNQGCAGKADAWREGGRGERA